jgi:hypothetical protein
MYRKVRIYIYILIGYYIYPLDIYPKEDQNQSLMEPDTLVLKLNVISTPIKAGALLSAKFH